MQNEIKFYVLISRCGTSFTETYGSTDLKKVQRYMKKMYKSACADIEEKTEHRLCNTHAVIETNGDWYEWHILDFNIPTSSELPNPKAGTLTNEIDPHRQVAIIWSIEDVQSVRPDLSDEQALRVLQEVKRRHDSNIGITWETIEFASEALFPSNN